MLSVRSKKDVEVPSEKTTIVGLPCALPHDATRVCCEEGHRIQLEDGAAIPLCNVQAVTVGHSDLLQAKDALLTEARARMRTMRRMTGACSSIVREQALTS